VTAEMVQVSPAWLELREDADAAARSTDLVDQLRPHLPTQGCTVVHDLGCGTGSMGRWLAPQLSGAQRWILYDTDADLLSHAAANPPRRAADGAEVVVETRQCDITRLVPSDLSDASLITASALLDMMTADELDRLVKDCARPGCPVLVTISVVGRVDLSPTDPLDELISGAFNAHQRRTTADRNLLGPDAVDAAATAFSRLGADVTVGPSPWRLDATQAALMSAWFTGWVGAACEQRPDLASAAAIYARRRLGQAAAGALSVTVYHQDLLVSPR